MGHRKSVSPKKLLKIRKLLAKLTGNDNTKAWLAWLNAPNKDLENKTPREVIKERGNKGAQIIIDLLEDALAGHPS